VGTGEPNLWGSEQPSKNLGTLRYTGPVASEEFRCEQEVVGGAVVVAKCSNSSCSASFRTLKEGRLFRLESDPAIRSSESNRTEYFWLCARCSSAMTLRLSENGTVVTVLLPEPIRRVPDDVALTAVDRKEGLLLRSVSFPLPEHFGGRRRRRLKDGHHAA